MPLIDCPECQQSVSDRATACPKCGHPISARRKQDVTGGTFSGTQKEKRRSAGAHLVAFLGIVIGFIVGATTHFALGFIVAFAAVALAVVMEYGG